MVWFLVKIINENVAQISGDEARHCVEVLRTRVGDKIQGIDGNGNYIQGFVEQIERINGNLEVFVKVINLLRNYNEQSYATGLIFSPLRQKERNEYIIEKAVELGVTHLYPVLCERTEKLEFKQERIQKIVIAALKQSQRSRLPYLSEFRPLAQTLKSIQQEDLFRLKLFAHCTAYTYLHSFANEVSTKNLVFAIGPVGDFTDDEILLAESVGFRSVSFGSIRLRSETATALALSYNKLIKQF